MFLSLAQSTENEEGNNSSVGLQALHLTCGRLPPTNRGSTFTDSALDALLPCGTYGSLSTYFGLGLIIDPNQ